MTLKEAIELRDKYTPLLIGKVMFRPNKAEQKQDNDIKITNVVIAPINMQTKVFMAMKETGKTNEQVLLSIGLDNFEVYLIGYYGYGYPVITGQLLTDYLKWTNQ